MIAVCRGWGFLCIIVLFFGLAIMFGTGFGD